MNEYLTTDVIYAQQGTMSLTTGSEQDQKLTTTGENTKNQEVVITPQHLTAMLQDMYLSLTNTISTRLKLDYSFCQRVDRATLNLVISLGEVNEDISLKTQKIPDGM